MVKLITGILIFFLSCSVYAAEYFSAPLLTADWKLKKGSSQCQLKQDIPLFGPVVFIQQSGEKLRFSISEQRYKAKIVKASLSIDTSSWKQQALLKKDYLVNLDYPDDNQHYPHLSVYGELAESMLDALAKGLNPTFSYARATFDGGSPETHVAISAINFKRKYQQFIDCRKDFLPYGFKEKLEKSLFFKPGSKRLSLAVLKQLKDTARYVKDVTGSRVVIVSDTAIAGSRDKRWFLNRAKIIANKLNTFGVANKKVIIKSGLYSAADNAKIIQLNVFGPDALKSIYYRKGNTKLTLTEQQRLDLLVHYAETFMPNSSLIIKTHTDAKGKQANNLKISQKRGEVIKSYLVSRGMDEKKVQVKAYGERKPVKSNRFPRGRAQNRRAIIDFVG